MRFNKKKKVLLVRLYLFDAALSVGAGILRNVAALRKMCFNAIQIGDGGQHCWCQLGRLFLHNMTGMLNYLGGETHYHAFWTDDALNSRAQMACCRRNLWKKQNKKTQLYDLFLLKAQRATVDYFAPTWRRIGPRCIVNGKHPRPSSWTEGGAIGALKTKNQKRKTGAAPASEGEFLHTASQNICCIKISNW